MQTERANNRVEREAQQRQAEAYGRVQLAIETGAGVDPSDWSKLSPAHMASAINRQKAEGRARRVEAEGRTVKTDWTLYLDLRQQAIDAPQKFAQLDLREYVDRIGPAQLEQLVDMKGSLIERMERPGKTPRDVVTLTQQMNATMAALKIKRADDKGRFISFVQAEVDDAAQAKGKPLTFDERQLIIDKAVLQGPDPDAWLWGEKRLYELTPEQRARFKPNAPTDAPATEVEALNDALRAQGLPPTPANRLALYQRAMSRGAGR